MKILGRAHSNIPIVFLVLSVTCIEIRSLPCSSIGPVVGTLRGFVGLLKKKSVEVSSFFWISFSCFRKDEMEIHQILGVEPDTSIVATGR